MTMKSGNIDCRNYMNYYFINNDGFKIDIYYHKIDSDDEDHIKELELKFKWRDVRYSILFNLDDDLLAYNIANTISETFTCMDIRKIICKIQNIYEKYKGSRGIIKYGNSIFIRNRLDIYVSLDICNLIQTFYVGGIDEQNITSNEKD